MKILKQLIIAILSVIVAISLFVGFHDIIVGFYSKKSSINWGINLQIYSYVAYLLYSITAIFVFFTKKRWLVYFISVAVFSLVCLLSFSSSPHRTILVLVSFILGLVGSLIVHQLYIKFNRSR